MNKTPPPNTLIKSAFFDTTPEILWSYLTEAKKLATWFHQATADLEKGEEYALFRIDEDGKQVVLIRGRVLEAQQPDRLVYTFVIDPFEGRESTVTWALQAIAGGTRLTLTHEGIEEAAGDAALSLFMALDQGWDAHIDTLRKQIG